MIILPRTYLLRMSQKLISSFFKTTECQKRKSSDFENADLPDKKKVCKENIDENVDLSTRKYIKELSLKLPALSPNIGLTWFKALEKEFSKEYFQKIGEFLKKERARYTIYPPEKEVYFWTNTVKIQDVKVVILGQDPYHRPNQAHGLAFSVRKGVAIPPSLQNIYKELADDIPGFQTPSHGFLYGWATQGVLLLNATLTVRAGDADSHKKESNWTCFTDAVIKWINDNLPYTVFMLWGKNAQEKTSLITKTKHLVLTAAHPSPFSAHNGFFKCKHFSRANEYLKKHDKKAIDWNYLP